MFEFIDPKQFEMIFSNWMKEVTGNTEDTVIAIDGNTMRGIAEKGSGKKAIYIVSAWCSKNNLVLGQVKTEEKSNEITAILELLDLLFIKGGIVTIDAMGCQKDISRKIIEESILYSVSKRKQSSIT